MSLHVRTATAFRWRPRLLAGRAEDLVRVVEDGEVRIAVLANGFECGFSTCWPPASRMVLDQFLDSWSSTSGSVPERLLAAFSQARVRFAAASPALITEASDFPDDVPHATLFAIAFSGATAHAVWIGGDAAVLARAFQPVTETTPHTFREQYKREHPGMDLEAERVPNFIVRTLGSRVDDQDLPAVASFEVEAGDALVVLSHAALRGPGVPPAEVAFAAAVHASPEALAERLAGLAFANEKSPYAAVAVLRFDALDLGAEISRLIHEYEPDPRHGDWLRDWSREHGALPVTFDSGGVIGMRRDGSVVSVAWDDPARTTRDETAAATHLAALVGASRTYPSLASLAPTRPADASSCLDCSSYATPPDLRPGCPRCSYLGWRLPELPSWFRLPVDHVPDESDRPIPDSSKRPWWRRMFGAGW